MPDRIRIIIFGKVQGVFFRRQIKQLAQKLNIKGYVRNLNDEVEAVCEGNKEALNEMILFCKKGPEGAMVTKIDVREIGDNEDNEKREQFEGFAIRY